MTLDMPMRENRMPGFNEGRSETFIDLASTVCSASAKNKKAQTGVCAFDEN
jgi:hypothetical protein